MVEDHGGDYRPTPGWPKPVGIISLVFGILAITCGVLGVAMMGAGDAMMSAMLGGQLPPGVPPPPTTPAIDTVMIVSTALGIVSNVILIAAAIALLKRRPAGRSLHLVYALVGVVSAFVSTYAGYQGQQKQQAAMEAWIADHGETEIGKAFAAQQQQQQSMQGTLQIASMGVGAAIWLAWPVFCIVWFGMVKRDTESWAFAEEST